MITSDGDKVSNPKHFKKHYRRLRKAQKNLSRKQKGSKNREKARIKVARIHAQITDSVKDLVRGEGFLGNLVPGRSPVPTYLKIRKSDYRSIDVFRFAPRCVK